MKNCIFCQIINRERPATIRYEDEDIIAIKPLKESAKGHTLVIPKKHAENLFDIPEHDMQKLAVVAKRLAKQLVDEHHATGINLLHATGADAQQSVFHLHFHLVPRHPNDGLQLWIKE